MALMLLELIRIPYQFLRSLSDEGSYELMVTNPQVPNLTLLSEPIVLSDSATLIEVKIDNFVKLDEDQVEFKTIGIGSSNIKDLIITNREILNLSLAILK